MTAATPTLLSVHSNQSSLPDDVAVFSDLIVNVLFVGAPAAGAGWTLIDADLPMSASAIIRAAEARFGAGTRPDAIVLTHGHFDHVGSLFALLNHWEVPVWAHALEAPYLTGRSSYPPPDPAVGGGLLARLSPLYPKGPIDLGDRLQILPQDHTVPPLPGWQWVHTPGHTAGHTSFFRPSDRTLLVGDAFVTTRQESVFGALTKYHAIHGPPMYFTSDWSAAHDSIQALAALNPAAAFPGHGHPVAGEQLAEDLKRLLLHFDTLALPRRGRYLLAPAIADQRGVVRLPPPLADPLPRLLGAVAIGAVMGYLLTSDRRSRR